MQRIERLMLRLLPLVLFVTCMVVVALAILIQRNNENIEKVSASVEHLEDFVADLEEETPDEQARSQAITEAVRQVPEIRGILCEQFPEATACISDSSP